MLKSKHKGNSVKLSTFNAWGYSSVIGIKTKVKDGATYVNFVWCKVCSKFKNCVLNQNVCGATKEAADVFVNGTNVVTKFTVS